MLKALSNTSQDLQLNDLWVMDVEVTDNDGAAVDQVPTFTVTLPSGVTASPVAEHLGIGTYRVAVSVLTTGRYIAKAETTAYGATSFATYVSGLTTSIPDVAAVRAYSNGEVSSSVWSDSEVQSALDAEFSQQRARCDVGAIYSPDLAEALKRRVLLNLKYRTVLTPAQTANEYTEGLSYVPGNDQHVKRLEAPHRKVVLI